MNVYLLYESIDWEGIGDITVHSTPEHALKYITAFMNRPDAYPTTVYQWVPVDEQSPNFKLQIVQNNSAFSMDFIEYVAKSWILELQKLDPIH